MVLRPNLGNAFRAGRRPGLVHCTRMLRCTSIPAILLILPAYGQVAQLQGGSLHINPGTSISFHQMAGLIIGPGTFVVNDGLIDLGAECLLTEQPGAPVTGSGTEIATWPIAAALVNAEPGRLGLVITTDYSGGDLLVTRGHVPISLPNTAQSIGRWFAIQMPAGSTDADIVLRYDPSEINGLDPSTLMLFESPAAIGPWTALASINEPGLHQLSALDQAPVAYLTAFDDSANGIAPHSASDTWNIWPTMVTDGVFIAIPESSTLSLVEVLDPVGRIIMSMPRSEAGPGQESVDLAGLASGQYLLRLNRQWTQRVIKQ